MASRGVGSERRVGTADRCRPELSFAHRGLYEAG
jgi:hypothetical protein